MPESADAQLDRTAHHTRQSPKSGRNKEREGKGDETVGRRATVDAGESTPAIHAAMLRASSASATLKRLFAQLTAAAVLLATTIPAGAWASATFSKSMKLQGISFKVQSTGEVSQQQLTITTTGTKAPVKPIQQTING